VYLQGQNKPRRTSYLLGLGPNIGKYQLARCHVQKSWIFNNTDTRT